MSQSTSIKLVDGLKDRIKAIAEDDRRSVNWLMNQALSEYADRRERRKAYLAGLRESHDEFEETGLHLTQDQVEEWMAKRAAGEPAPMPKLNQ
jgi:predicted transcriptional regulator